MSVTKNADRYDFSRGWVPSYDDSSAPPNGLLRMDNCILDDLNVVSVRKGSDPLYTLDELDVHSLFSTTVDGVNFRYAGAGASTYRNGNKIVTGFDGDGDIAFGAYAGQVMMARGTVKKKDDGNTVRRWGVQAPPTPTAAAVVGSEDTIIAGSSGEGAAWVYANGSFNSYVAGEDGSGNAATKWNTDDSGVITATHDFGGTRDYSGLPEDLFEVFVNLSSTQALASFILQFDCNDGSFHRDFFFHIFTPDDPAFPIKPDVQALSGADVTSGNFDVVGSDRGRFQVLGDPLSPPPAVIIQRGADFSLLSVVRSAMERSGQTAGKDWDTIRAVRFQFNFKGDESSENISTVAVEAPPGTVTTHGTNTTTVSPIAEKATIQTLKLSRGPLTGVYKARAVYVANLSSYQIKGVPSGESNQVEVKHGTINLHVTASADPQVDQIWVYLFGGSLDNWYRTLGPFPNTTATVSLDSSDRDMLTLDEVLELDNAEPPDSIVGIAGPHFSRLFALDVDGLLHPSRILNPDSFATGQGLQVSDKSKTYFWVAKTLGGLYVGASDDIYRISGDGAEAPDGSINFRIDPLNIASPPIAPGFAVEGNTLFYVAAGGWHEFNGQNTIPLREDEDLLWKGYTRFGVSPVDLTGRFRAAASKQVLVTVTPETINSAKMRIDEFPAAPHGGGLDSLDRSRYPLFGFESNRPNFPGSTVHRYDGRLKRWYRHIYPHNIKSVYRDVNGSIMAGDSAGNVLTLDSGTDDSGVPIPVEIWSRLDDQGSPLFRKDSFDFQIHVDTHSQQTAVYMYTDKLPLDDNSIPTQPDKVIAGIIADGSGPFRANTSDVPPYLRMVTRIIGSFSHGFILNGFTHTFRARPQLALRRDTGYVNLDRAGAINWLRGVWIRVWATGNLQVIAFLDDVQQAPILVQDIKPNQTTKYWVPFPRNFFAYQLRVAIQSADDQPFELYSVSMRTGAAGDITELVKADTEAA